MLPLGTILCVSTQPLTPKPIGMMISFISGTSKCNTVDGYKMANAIVKLVGFKSTALDDYHTSSVAANIFVNKLFTIVHSLGHRDLVRGRRRYAQAPLFDVLKATSGVHLSYWSCRAAACKRHS